MPTDFDKGFILTINGGSSSIKFSLYEISASPHKIISGEIKAIGTNHSSLSITDHDSGQNNNSPLPPDNKPEQALINTIRQWDKNIIAIGHRIVHGMDHSEPELISEDLIEELETISSYDPDHLPAEIKLIKLFKKQYPGIPQIACFDTSFHHTMPAIAKLLSIPRRYYDKGIRRYGFHGISYSYLMETLGKTAGQSVAGGKVILAHLGSGASLAAVMNGQCMDTSMGFTPAAGLPMSSRSGDLDPGVASYLMHNEKLSAAQFDHLINHESGLLGISGTSADMKVLLDAESFDKRAAEAIELFCYQTRKWIGAYAAVLDGLDTLVFCGGIGEKSAVIRARICQDMNYLGIRIDEDANQNNSAIISTNDSRVCVRVIPTDEESMIAKSVYQIINNSTKTNNDAIRN